MGRFSARQVAVVGALAVLGLTLHVGVPHPVRPGTGRPGSGQSRPVSSGDARGGVVPMAAMLPAAGAMFAPVQPAPAVRRDGTDGSGRLGRPAGQAASFRQIILPDLLIVAPRGLTARQVARLRAVTGVRDLITFDGARIKMAGRAVNVIGVDPATFRSWVPLRTASDQALWAQLSKGDFVASSGTGLALRPGASYRLVGASPQVIRFGSAGELGLAGIDLVVDQQTSARLGLVRRVAGLISAPGVGLATLTRKVSAVLGPSGKIEVLRSQSLPVAPVPAGGKPATYLQLFKASAALYCPGLSWTVLAAIGQIESADGTNMGPSTAGALGPMQFLPSTWAVWGIDGFGETGKPDVMNPFDAVPSAARLLCADGAAAGGQSLRDAIFGYNHATWYVNEVLALAAEYAADYR
jgi:hypothetical protein